MYRRTAFVVAIGLVLAACGGSSVSAPDTGGDGSEIIIDSFTFAPSALDVRVGDTITWRNDQNTAHTTVSGVVGGWTSDLLEPGDSFSHTFTETGQFPYSCTIHPSMIGVINVAP